MTTTRRAALRRIMDEAWGWFHQVGGTFAEALRIAWRAHFIRTTPRVELRTVKSGARNLSPLRETAFLARRYASNTGGTRYAQVAMGAR